MVPFNQIRACNRGRVPDFSLKGLENFQMHTVFTSSRILGNKVFVEKIDLGILHIFTF